MAWEWLNVLDTMSLAQYSGGVENLPTQLLYENITQGDFKLRNDNLQVNTSTGVGSNADWIHGPGSTYYLQYVIYRMSGNNWTLELNWRYNNALRKQINYNFNVSSLPYNKIDLMIAIDRESQKAYPVWILKNNNNNYWTWNNMTFPSNTSWMTDFYNWIKDLIPTPISWSPVTSISGNGEVYTLAKIAQASLNGGNPVTGASSSNFDVLTDASLVLKMIEDVLPSGGGNKVIATYSIPEGTYEYIKLVYKKGSIPTSYSDGTAIDITQASTEQQISGIADGDTYYFVIFTDKSASEPKSIKTIVGGN